MYKSVRIQNFRGLRDLKMDDLGRVNLIVGANNVGKTSVLEALWLFQDPGNPSLTIDLARARWHNPLPKTPELLWHGLFGDRVVNNPIRIQGGETNGTVSTLEITLSAGGEESGILNDQQLIVAETLRFRFDLGDGQDVVDSSISIVGPDIRIQAKDIPNRSGAFLPADQHITPETIADHFTRAQDSRMFEKIVEILQSLDHRVVGLTLGYYAAERRPMIRVHLQSSNSPVELNMLGGGSLRIVEILLNILNTPHGMLLVDDLDDGIYARNLTEVWKNLDEASDQSSVQIMATTHSWECVESAVQAFEASPEDFQLHRLERRDGEIRVVTYDHVLARAAVTGLVEVR